MVLPAAEKEKARCRDVIYPTQTWARDSTADPATHSGSARHFSSPTPIRVRDCQGSCTTNCSPTQTWVSVKKKSITPRQARRVRREILVNTKLEPGQDLEANTMTTFDPGGRFHELRSGKRPTGAR